MDSPEIHILHQSDFYQISNYRCRCTECHTSGVEYSQSFNLCFVRSGYFEYQVFRKELELHVGRIMVSKPGTEHITRHIDNHPDICSVFDLSPAFVQSLQDHYAQEAGWFFQNKDLHSLLLRCPADLDYLHRMILQQALLPNPDTLLMDEWVLRLVDKVMRVLGNEPAPAPIPVALKRHHLSTVEKAKDYLTRHFHEAIRLQDVAEHCCISLFHFSRIFKAVMNCSPYQYVQEVRLNHAHILLETSTLPVSEIAFQCGFNSLEHFDNAYRQRFNMTPSAHRKLVS